MLTIEFENPEISLCECCGNKTVRLTRFVYQGNDAFAIYYIIFTENHSTKTATGLISIGDWTTDEEPVNRTAFPFKIWETGDTYQIGLLNKIDSPWQAPVLGKILDREAALTHSRIKEVFHITDHIMSEDQMVIDYFKAKKS